MSTYRVLVACECSGVVRRAFAARGHDAWSCDLKPCTDGSPNHIQGDALQVLARGCWDVAICHPPCTYLSVSGMHWTARGLRDPQLTEDALTFFRACLDAPCPRVCVENPVGVTSTRIRPPDQWVQPYEYGDDASKRTGLWLRGLPLLSMPRGRFITGRAVCKRCKHCEREGLSRQEMFRYGCNRCGAEAGFVVSRWSNQTDSGQNRLGPSDRRASDRAQTYPGLARAMAKQWG